MGIEALRAPQEAVHGLFHLLIHRSLIGASLTYEGKSIENHGVQPFSTKRN